MAIAITNLFQPALLLFYVRYITPSTLACWPGFTRSAFHNWGPMFRLAVPGILMIEAEWFAFEILTISSAFLGRPYLAAQSVLVNTTLLMCHLPFSASVAVSTRVGNLIGCGAIPAAKVAVKTFYMFFIIVGLIDMGVMIGLKGAIPRVFSRDDVVMALVETVMPPCALFQLVYCMSTLCNGLLRGLGRQKIGGLANLVSYYGVSLEFPSPFCSSNKCNFLSRYIHVMVNLILSCSNLLCSISPSLSSLDPLSSHNPLSNLLRWFYSSISLPPSFSPLVLPNSASQVFGLVSPPGRAW